MPTSSAETASTPPRRRRSADEAAGATSSDRSRRAATPSAGDGHRRDAALAETTDELVRRGKRALQDEQNDLLDGLRRQRGKIDTTKVLPPAEDQLARWAHVLQPAVDAAYSAGARPPSTAAATAQARRRGPAHRAGHARW